MVTVVFLLSFCHRFSRVLLEIGDLGVHHNLLPYLGVAAPPGGPFFSAAGIFIAWFIICSLFRVHT